MKALAVLAAAALALAGCSGGAMPVSVGVTPAQEWTATDALTGKISDVAGLVALARNFPDSGSVRLRLLNARLGSDDLAGSFDDLVWLTARGYRFGDAAREQLLWMYEGAQRDALAAAFANTPPVIVTSRTLATVPAKALLVESVIRDPANGRLLVTSVLGKQVFGHAPDGGFRGVSPTGADNLSGIVRDQTTGAVWVSSGNIDQSTDSVPGFAGLIQLTPLGAKAVRMAAPDGASPSDLAIGPDGMLYASDPITGAVYRGKRGASDLDTLIPAGNLRSPQGIAVDPEGQYLHVSDYRYGLARYDFQTGALTRVRVSEGLMIILDGIDGLWRHGSELIAMQNGTSPMRIAAFKLLTDGHRIVGHRILEQANPAWTEPLGGSVDSGELVYVANGQWDVFGDDGVVREGKQPKPTEIRVLPLD
ncbi:SMP-30/gluconolactonase/LRE family protein [Qipengyuania marisflavi]|uniref:SMP-30/Gluconolactonase/LRE-like region domain-containing protein n=1 Tax=Qipengyuania marisflavi TaxID=2486356 RepID=A0A5S3PEJ9_9SPHN|nr:hypothetical protein [Qipengyuania marisflavi]TMM50000.1 hypothetical protein FEV51_02025 [Qipengyuania marisflavi]